MWPTSPFAVIGAGFALTVVWFYLAWWVWPPEKANKWQSFVIVALGLCCISVLLAGNLLTPEPARKECHVSSR